MTNLPCPFCGHPPVLFVSSIDVGGGDIQKAYSLFCCNSECLVKPTVTNRGERGYKREEDLTNQQAMAATRFIWNHRSHV